MNQQSYIKDLDFDPIPILQQKKDLPSQLKTQQDKFKAYLQFLTISDLSKIGAYRQQFMKRLPFDIEFDQSSKFFKKVIVKIVKHTKNFQFIDLEVRFGYFLFKKVSIISIEGESSTHQITNNDSGKFCTVFFCKHKGSSLAFKCFSKEKLLFLLEEGNILGRVIQEYCILKLASAMKIGPKMYSAFGFDIMVYPNCIQFCMEGCEPFPQNYMLTIQQIDMELKEGLAKMHSVKIVHHDIKMENISFSKEFNKLVFIDFGMSRILEENIGFKSLTTFKGSLNHCSGQMVALNRQNSHVQKPIDLYFNDMIALKITLEQLRKEEFQQDIALISKQQKLKIIKNVNEIHITNSIKYALFHLQQQLFLKMLQKQQKHEVYNIFFWAINIKNSPKMSRIYHRLLSLVKQQKKKQFQIPWINEQVQQKRSQSIQMQTLRQLNVINHYQKVSYFNNQFHINFSQLFIFLKNTQKNLQISIEDYYCLLAKAIQINLSGLSSQKISILCNKAFQRSQQLYKLQQDRIKFGKKIDHFTLVIKFLFQKSFINKLKGNYLSIFLSTVNSIVIQSMLSNEEIAQYYLKLLEMELNFRAKTEALTSFLSATHWLYFGSLNLGKYFDLTNLINQKTLNTLNRLDYNAQQKQFLKTVLLRQQYYYPYNQLQIINGKYSTPKIKIWLISNKIKNLCFQRDIFSELQELVCQEQNSVSSPIFEYYHFYLIFYYTFHKDISKNLYLITRFEKSLRNKTNNPFLIFTKSLINLFQTNFKNIGRFIKQVSSLKDCEHLLITYRLKFYIRFIHLFYRKQFEELQLQTQKICFQIRLNATIKAIFTKKNKEQKIQYVDAISKVTNLSFIEKDFKSILGNDYNRFKEQNQNSKKNYFKLRKLLPKTNTLVDNSLFISNNYLLLVLLMNQGSYKQALSLAKYLNQILSVIPQIEIQQETILQYTFAFIIHPMQQKEPLIKDQNRHLYFQYAKIIEKNKRQEIYLKNTAFFIDIVRLMYKYWPQQLPQIINKTSAILLSYNNRAYVQNYLFAFQVIFKLGNQYKQFHNTNTILEKQLLSTKSPYSVIPLFHIYLLKQFSCTTKQNIIKIVLLLPQVSIVVRQNILQRLYFCLFSFYANSILLKRMTETFSTRKKMMIYKKQLSANEAILSDSQQMKLFVKKQCINTLNKIYNINKKRCLERKFTQFNMCVGQTQLKDIVQKGRISYGDFPIISLL